MRKSNPHESKDALHRQIVYSFGDHYYFRKELKILNLLTGYEVLTLPMCFLIDEAEELSYTCFPFCIEFTGTCSWLTNLVEYDGKVPDWQQKKSCHRFSLVRVFYWMRNRSNKNQTAYGGTSLLFINVSSLCFFYTSLCFLNYFNFPTMMHFSVILDKFSELN